MKSGMLKRFESSEIVLHWFQALGFLALGTLGTILLLSKWLEISPEIREQIAEVHKIFALFWLFGLLISFIAGNGKLYLVNIKTVFSWEPSDLQWLFGSLFKTLNSKIKLPKVGKFNAGQKINMVASMFLVLGFAVTGTVMWICPTALAPWYMHVFLFLLFIPLIFGHLFMALVNPSTRAGLGGIFHGWVNKKYIEDHHALTLETIEEKDD